MKYLCLVVLLCQLSLLKAHCYQKAIKPGMTHCQDDVDKTWHQIGSSWRNSACMDCSCSGCCTSYSTPTEFPPDCESVFDAKACIYRVQKKNDPSVECPIYSGVGK